MGLIKRADALVVVVTTLTVVVGIGVVGASWFSGPFVESGRRGNLLIPSTAADRTLSSTRPWANR
jgi:hypothetical protein